MLAIAGAEHVASGANFRNGGLVTTDMASALQLLRTVEYQEKTLPSLIRLRSISPDGDQLLKSYDKRIGCNASKASFRF